MTENTQLQNAGKLLKGKVVSNSMNKTITVLVTRKTPHPVYKKMISKSIKVAAHDESNECEIGDSVEIMECRPLSRRKTFKLVNRKK